MSAVAAAAAATVSAERLEERAPGRIVARRAPQAGEEADDQVVARGRQAGAAADQALERARRLVGRAEPGPRGRGVRPGDRRLGSTSWRRHGRRAGGRAASARHAARHARATCGHRSDRRSRTASSPRQAARCRGRPTARPRPAARRRGSRPARRPRGGVKRRTRPARRCARHAARCPGAARAAPASGHRRGGCCRPGRNTLCTAPLKRPRAACRAGGQRCEMHGRSRRAPHSAALLTAPAGGELAEHPERLARIRDPAEDAALRLDHLEARPAGTPGNTSRRSRTARRIRSRGRSPRAPWCARTPRWSRRTRSAS